MRISPVILPLFIICGAYWVEVRAFADVFELTGGGEVAGDVVERGSGGNYVVRTSEGVQFRLARDGIARVASQSKQLAEYKKRSQEAVDEIDAHRRLAAWCREQGLTVEADRHLSRLLELDPEDESARRSLGFIQADGRWLTRNQLMALRGLELFDGRYRTSQDIAIRKREVQRDSAEVDWFGNLRLWCEWLQSGRAGRVEEAQRQIAAINDPHATPAIVKLLYQQEDQSVFSLLLKVLGQMRHPLAVETLVAISLESSNEETRTTCLDYLTDDQQKASIVPYVLALRSKDNRIVNRAGEALGRIGDSAAISPLIDALVTRHRYQVQASQPGQMNAAFDPSGAGGGGLAFGGGPKIIEQDRENQSVLRALNKLSGEQDFGYKQQAWRRWFVEQQKHVQINSRRDE